ncbi:methyltransferase domain-containing protein [Patescibacteria group bacterium]|nr:methyltransferase domain-containing protein [Patescibacteria group bacterium]
MSEEQNELKEDQLKEKISKLSQFPHKARKENYQSYYINGELVPGSRDTDKRFELMGIPEDMTDMTVLDLGANLGAICCECWKRGARHIMGIDNEADYIDCARDLARHNGYSINYEVKDLTDISDSIIYIKPFFDQTSRPISIIFALSLYKHIKGYLFSILDRLKWYTCYIESNNSPQGEKTPHCQEIIEHIESRGWKYELVGIDKTRSPRCVWKVEKK